MWYGYFPDLSYTYSVQCLVAGKSGIVLVLVCDLECTCAKYVSVHVRVYV